MYKTVYTKVNNKKFILLCKKFSFITLFCNFIKGLLHSVMLLATPKFILIAFKSRVNLSFTQLEIAIMEYYFIDMKNCLIIK